jgi:hypothetical protein
MSSHSGHFQASEGYNQQGGAYYYVISSVVGQFQTYTPGSGSGGATTVGSFADFAYSGTVDQSTILGANNVVKDMGKTVVSAGRTFRKFQAVYPQTLSTGGVSGGAASTTNPGYLTGYLEISKDGSGVEAARIVRYA